MRAPVSGELRKDDCRLTLRLACSKGGVHGPTRGAGHYLSVNEVVRPSLESVGAARGQAPTELEQFGLTRANEVAAKAALEARSYIENPAKEVPQDLQEALRKARQERKKSLLLDLSAGNGFLDNDAGKFMCADLQ